MKEGKSMHQSARIPPTEKEQGSLTGIVGGGDLFGTIGAHLQFGVFGGSPICGTRWVPDTTAEQIMAVFQLELAMARRQVAALEAFIVAVDESEAGWLAFSAKEKVKPE